LKPSSADAPSEEIEKTAEEIMRGADEITEKLRDLARAIREQIKITDEHVSGFVTRRHQRSKACVIFT
jgi:hypothetical protein